MKRTKSLSPQREGSALRGRVVSRLGATAAVWEAAESSSPHTNKRGELETYSVHAKGKGGGWHQQKNVTAVFHEENVDLPTTTLRRLRVRMDKIPIHTPIQRYVTRLRELRVYATGIPSTSYLVTAC